MIRWRKKLATILLMCLMLVPATIFTANSMENGAHHVHGDVYIDGNLASSGVTVSITFPFGYYYNDTVDGYYSIFFEGHDNETGNFSVLYKGKLYEPTNKEIYIEHDKLDYPIDLYVVTVLDTIYVDVNNTEGPWDGTQEHPYQHIQDGVDAAIEDKTVHVVKGTYKENVIIDKRIKLKGENKESIIDGDEVGNVVIINVDNVLVSNFKIQNSGYNQSGGKYQYDAGIRINSNSNQVKNNYIEYNHYGILMDNSQGNEIVNNTIINNRVDGIGLFESSNNNQISSNIIAKNTEVGIYFFKSSNNKIIDNKIYENSLGIRIYSTSNNNRIDGNRINNSIYAPNWHDRSATGITIEAGPMFNSVYENNITENKRRGIYLWRGCNFNTIIRNNFIKNGEMDGANAEFDGCIWNQWNENYYDDWDEPGQKLNSYIIGGSIFGLPWFNRDIYRREKPVVPYD